jgi:hypothetical protein
MNKRFEKNEYVDPFIYKIVNFSFITTIFTQQQACSMETWQVESNFSYFLDFFTRFVA